MAEDQISYLNRTSTSSFYSRLTKELAASKQAKAPAAQWTGLIKGLTQKGVKGMEIEESGVLTWLADQGKAVVTREDLIAAIDRRTATIKEVRLGSPKYSGWRHKGGDYAEFLYIANSERDNIQDEIDQVDYELEQLNFDIERLAENPEEPLRLANLRSDLFKQMGQAIDFTHHHYSDVVTGKLGRNLVAHARTSVFPGFYLIHEIQSDWGQQGRKNNWANGYPKGPLVTDTEAWAGMVLRRHLQLAAQNDQMNKVLWIRGNMRNGWDNRGGDGLDDFYMKILPKLAEKALKGTDGKCTMHKVMLDGREYEVPGFEITPKVREVLMGQQPLYSRAPLLPQPRSENDPEVQAALLRGSRMLGSAKHIRMFQTVWDVATGRRVAGRYANRLASIALNAEDLNEAVDHECVHFAFDNLLGSYERDIVREAFRPGTPLHFAVTDRLVRQRKFDAALQCDQSAEEAAAHGFALWRAGALEIPQPQVTGIFSDLVAVVKDALRWFKREVLGQEIQTVEDFYQHLVSGHLADRQREFELCRTRSMQA